MVHWHQLDFMITIIPALLLLWIILETGLPVYSNIHTYIWSKICKKGPYCSSILYKKKKTDTPGVCMILEPAALIHLFIFIFCVLGRLYPWMFWSPCGQFKAYTVFFFLFYIHWIPKSKSSEASLPHVPTFRHPIDNHTHSVQVNLIA